MIKYILFLLSEYYYGIVAERIGEIQAKVASHQVKALLAKSSEGIPAECEAYITNTLILADEPEIIQALLTNGRYVVILYHERNKGTDIPGARYGVEDVFQLAYRSYEETYRRLAGFPWNILETDRLKVRESTVEDVNEFYRIYEDPSITLYMENLYQEREAELAYMRAYIDQIYGFYGYGLWTVILKATGEVIGRAGLSVREGYETPELGFVIDVLHQRQGYGYEVSAAILQYAREELEFDEVQAMVKEDNLVSRHLLAKLGFVFARDVTESGRSYKLLVKKLKSI